MIADVEPLVVSNVVLCLEEMYATEGGLMLTKEIAYALFNSLKEFSEWAQCDIMALLTRYVPNDDDEIFTIMNLLDGRLQHANAGVVLAAAKLFLYFTRNMDSIRDDVYQRLKVPLLTLMAASASELTYVCLQHLQIMLTRVPALLFSDHASFFCRCNDALYVKYLKLDIMTAICTGDNIKAIIDELTVYVTDVDMVSISVVVRWRVLVPGYAGITSMSTIILLPWYDGITSY